MSKRKSDFLGMPFGTANYRLHRRILFDLLRKVGENYCFRCREEIESVHVLSIEHKKNWLDVDSELFWAMDNIAFSHRDCNSGYTSNRIKSPEGTSWCGECKEFKPLDQFWSMSKGNGRAENSKYPKCKVCKNTRQTEYRERTGRKKEGKSK